MHVTFPKKKKVKRLRKTHGPTYAELRKAMKTMRPKELAEYYGVGRTLIIAWIKHDNEILL